MLILSLPVCLGPDVVQTAKFSPRDKSTRKPNIKTIFCRCSCLIISKVFISNSSQTNPSYSFRTINRFLSNLLIISAASNARWVGICSSTCGKKAVAPGYVMHYSRLWKPTQHNTAYYSPAFVILKCHFQFKLWEETNDDSGDVNYTTLI